MLHIAPFMLHIEPSTSTNRPDAAAQRPLAGAIVRAQGQAITPTGGGVDAAVKSPDQLPVRPDGTKPHILYITGGVGGGHKSPANAEVGYLLKRGDVNVTYYRDVAVGPFHFRNRGPLDHVLYSISNFRLGAKFANRWREIGPQRQAYTTVQNLLSDPTQFDLVIVNHRILGRIVTKHLPITKPMILVTADPGEIHVGWYPVNRFNNPLSQDRIVVPTEIGARHAARYLPADKIARKTYPVRRAFERIASTHTRNEVREELGFPNNKRIVLHTAGGGGQASEYSMQVIRRLVNDPRADRIHLVVVTGGNKDLKRQLDELKATLPSERAAGLDVRGHCDADEMAKLTYAADVPGIQAGGGSIGENLALGNVMFVYQQKSGVEHQNVQFVRDQNVGVVALELNQYVEAVFSTTDEALALKRENAANFGDPIRAGAQARANFYADRARCVFQRS